MEKTEKTSELVWLYVKRRPFLKEAIRQRIVNFSALARQIASDALGKKDQQYAVKMALIRLASKMREGEENLEQKIKGVLKKSSMSIRTKVAVLISTRKLETLDYISCAESKGITTYILEESELNRFKRAKTALKAETNLDLIAIHSGPDLERVPGVISHMLGALAGEGINVVEFVSCYTDTLLVVRQADTAQAHEILAGMMN